VSASTSVIRSATRDLEEMMKGCRELMEKIFNGNQEK
jgi:hypothetical protein